MILLNVNSVLVFSLRPMNFSASLLSKISKNMWMSVKDNNNNKSYSLFSNSMDFFQC